MKDVYILAIESSCDETSVAIIKNGKEDLATVISTQIDIHKNFGGVVPEIASRKHIENITMVLEEALTKAKMTMDDITAIAVTVGPGLIGSLLVGVEAAKTLGFLYQKPVIPVQHITGHIYANAINNDLKFPLLTLVVSGGHTELIYMRDHLSFEKIGGTLDDAVGEAYDKVSRALGFGYPGGPIIDQMAASGEVSYPLPLPMNDDSYQFSFSGIKSAVMNLIHNEKQRGNEIRKEDMAATFQDRVVTILVKKTLHAAKEYQVKNVLLSGGVAANKGLRLALKDTLEQNGIDLSVPDFKYCTDNASMIGAAGYFYYQLNKMDTYPLAAKANLEIQS